MTLEDCERDTRISKRYLDALEREDWKVFPAPVYSRAFLRTYAQYLSLDAAELMRMFQPPEPELKPLPEIKAGDPTGSMNFALAGGVLLFLLIAGIFLWRSSTGGDDSVTVTGPTTVATLTTEGSGGGPRPALGRPVGEVRKGEVPDLSGVRIDDALTALSQAGLDYLIVETAAANGQAGIVLSQQPAAGTKAGGETSVTLLVPRG